VAKAPSPEGGVVFQFHPDDLAGKMASSAPDAEQLF